MTTKLDLTAGYDALRTGVGALWLPCDVVAVRGPDAVSFLQGQLSQDVERLAVGAAAWSLVLQPQGKVDALVRVARLADDELVLAVDGGWGEALLARLSRFKLRVKAELEPVDWRCLAVRGPGAEAAAAGAAATVRVDASWPGLPGVDLLGPADDLAVPGDAPLVGDDAWAAARIEAGVPVMGAELDERTIPAEAGVVERTVSFTKGCYTGQELVARIDSRGGNVPRHLAGVVVEAGSETGDRPPAGATIVVGDRDAGTLTSVADSPALGVVALAYVRRDVPAEATAVVRWETDGGPVERPARVAPLPLVP